MKLILDTDIGTNVDDAWALALCLASDEVDLIGVTLVHGDLDMRAEIAQKMLRLAGRSHVLVVPSGASDFILQAVRSSLDEVAICSIGPMSNIAEAIRRDTDTMCRVRKLAIMAGSYEGDGPECARRETNACGDPEATKLVLESRIQSAVVGLNVTNRAIISKDDAKGLEGTPFRNYLAQMTYQHCEAISREYSVMHDPLTLAILLDPALVSTRKMSATVLTDGRIAYKDDPSGWLDVAIDVNEGKFVKMLMDRIRSLE